MYAFGIILFEIYGRQGPYGEELTEHMSIPEILQKITKPEQGEELMRPNIEVLRDIASDTDTDLPEYMVTLMQVGGRKKRKCTVNSIH